MDSAVLEDVKACLRSGDGWVILEFADKEDENKEGNRINGESNGNKEDESREGSKIDSENNSENEDD